MDFEEKTLKRESKFKGHIFEVAVDEVLLPDGKTAGRELIFHKGAVAVLAVTPEGKIIIVKQYRKAIEAVSYEIPAGKLEVGEAGDEMAAAARELEEETQYKGDLELIYEFYTAIGFCNERIKLYVATNLKPVENPRPLDDDEFLELYELCKYHVSGQLKVAPEHISDNVLKYMGKPENSVFNKFSDKFYQINEKIGKKQYLVPYLMSSHPGSTIRDAVRLAEYLHEHNINPQQVQDFYPTPGTISTCMFYTGIDPFTMKKVYVPKTPHEKSVQRALLQYRNPENYKLVYEALTKIGRTVVC